MQVVEIPTFIILFFSNTFAKVMNKEDNTKSIINYFYFLVVFAVGRGAVWAHGGSLNR